MGKEITTENVFENPRAFSMNNFKNNIIKSKPKLLKLNNLIGSGFYCKTEEFHFPHLIGIKKSPPTINSIKQFIGNIHYEQSLIQDYTLHGMEVDKLNSFGWIKQTINDPDLVFLSDAITSSFLTCHIASVKKIIGNPNYHYHVVCMHKTKYSFKNKPVFAINSQFPKKIGCNLQFNSNKAVFVKKK